jgi:hypothetical protein
VLFRSKGIFLLKITEKGGKTRTGKASRPAATSLLRACMYVAFMGL